MCIFSGPVQTISGTHIFARGVGDRQLLVYSMNYAAPAHLAMVLPLPVPFGTSENAVRFISLEGYGEFFSDLREGWPAPVAAPRALNDRVARAVLKVHEVGRFEASFVPTQADFSRLDRRFRLPAAVWTALPGYRDYGYAVFKLKSTAALWSRVQRVFGRGHGGDQRDAHHLKTVHPMALEFPRRDASALFFPTTHVHDGTVHGEAMFDHTLFCQIDSADTDAQIERGWLRSLETAGRFMDVRRSRELIDAERHCWKLELHGLHENRDTWSTKAVPTSVQRRYEIEA